MNAQIDNVTVSIIFFNHYINDFICLTFKVHRKSTLIILNSIGYVLSQHELEDGLPTECGAKSMKA